MAELIIVLKWVGVTVLTLVVGFVFISLWGFAAGHGITKGVLEAIKKFGEPSRGGGAKSGRGSSTGSPPKSATDPTSTDSASSSSRRGMHSSRTRFHL